MEILVPGDSILHIVDQMVVSVGPYTFQSATLRANNWFAKSRCSDSPPDKIFNCPPPSQPPSISIPHVPGVACITVALPPLKRCSLPHPSPAVPPLTCNS